jgi:hypothetical protein
MRCLCIKNMTTFSLGALLSLLVLGLISSSAFADCSTDNPPTCVYVPTSPNNIQSVKPAFNGATPACEQVTNNCKATVMVPTGNQLEWTSFVSSKIANGGCIALGTCGGGAVGQCGSDSGQTDLTSPPVNLCAAGSTLDNNKGGLSGGQNGPWSWYCIANSVDSPQCTASEGAPQTCPVLPEGTDTNIICGGGGGGDCIQAEFKTAGCPIANIGATCVISSLTCAMKWIPCQTGICNVCEYNYSTLTCESQPSPQPPEWTGVVPPNP